MAERKSVTKANPTARMKKMKMGRYSNNMR
jgi:hypothetical protein